MFNKSIVFLRRFKRIRKLAFLTGLVCLLVTVLFLTRHREIPPAWRSDSVEAGLLRVMQYIEREGDLDGIVRDEFVDRIWRNMKSDLVNDLVYKSKLGFVSPGGTTKAESESESRNRTNTVYDFIKENADVLRYALLENGRDVNVFDDGNVDSGVYGGVGYKNMKIQSHRSPYSSPVSLLQLLSDNDRLIGNTSVMTKEELAKFLSNPILNPFEFSYKFDQSNTCLTNDAAKDVKVIIAVPSAPGNFKRRENVRISEMAKFAKNPNNRAKLVFFLGDPSSSSGLSPMEVQTRINEEENRFGDIVQASFVDSYRNITKKAAQLLHWSSTRCPKGKFLIRVDDDVTVNITKIVEVMEHHQTKDDHFIVGTMRTDWKPHRKRKSKYFIPFEETPHKSHPPFLLGGAYGYPIRTAGLLLEAMRRVPLIWLDDLYLTAMCAKRVKVPIFDNDAFRFEHE